MGIQPLLHNSRRCLLCSAAAELDPVLKGFDHGFDGAE
jgi:hypothetical protein